ncbi:hypothetical protein Tco_0876457 [Tanacetum coccineum]|uniref:Uncharacterized protein n=1 Tax=Tanacetum coccineum TaxID=301880 RepID=A0ABQ5BS94_9ASTR
MVAATEPKTIQKAVQIADTLTNEALRNGSIKKNHEKRGNGGEPSKDRNVRDDNKRTRTGNAFATTTNPIERENTGTGRGNQGNQARGKAFMLGAKEARQVPNIVTDTMMSDSKDSIVTYTAVSSPFGGLSDIGSPRVDRPPMMPKDPYAYVSFVPEPLYPEFIPPEDEILPAEEQPLPVAVSPTANSPGYVPESDPEEDPEEDDDEDPKEDLADYPADGGDDGDDEDESSNDDEDEDVDIKGDEEEEEHPAPAHSIVVALPAVDHAPSAEENEPFETDESMATPPPHPVYRVTARISIQDEPPTPFWSNMEVASLLAIPTPPPSLLSLWSSPLPQIPSPPLPLILSLPLPISSPPPASPIHSLGYRAAMNRLRAEAPSTSHSPLPHIILSHTRPDAPSSGTPPLHLLSTDHRKDRPKVTLPPQKRLGITISPRYEVGESSYAPTARPPRGFKADYGFVATINREIMQDLERDVSYGITDTWDEMLVDMLGEPVTDDTELGRRMTKFTTRVRQDTNEIYMRLDDKGYVVTYSGGSTACSDYRATGSGPQKIGGDYKDAGGGP